MLLSIQLLIFIYYNNGAVDMQICALLTRIQCKVSDTQVITVKACGPLVLLVLYLCTNPTKISQHFASCFISFSSFVFLMFIYFSAILFIFFLIYKYVIFHFSQSQSTSNFCRSCKPELLLSVFINHRN